MNDDAVIYARTNWGSGYRFYKIPARKVDDGIYVTTTRDDQYFNMIGHKLWLDNTRFFLDIEVMMDKCKKEIRNNINTWLGSIEKSKKSISLLEEQKKCITT